MLPKEDRELISKIGRYKYNKMRDMNLTYEQFLEYEKQIKEERKLKEKIGNRNYNKMKKLGFTFEEYKQYLKEQKLKKYEKKREKDKIRQKTVRYIERYCNLDMKCQICNAENDIQIHHPNYNDYLKINLLCRRHHTDLHNFELIPPQVINLQEIAIKKQVQKEKQIYIEKQIKNIKQDILNNQYTYRGLSNKYKISYDSIRQRLKKEEGWAEIKIKIKENAEKKRTENRLKKMKHKDNPIQKYRIEKNLTIKQFSNLTGIPMPTISAIECGKVKIENIKGATRKKLEILKEVV